MTLKNQANIQFYERRMWRSKYSTNEKYLLFPLCISAYWFKQCTISVRDSTIPSFVFKERQLLLLPVPRISILFKSERVCTLGDVNFSCTSRDTQKYFESYLPCMSHDSINFIVGREIAKCAFRHYINRTQSYVVRDDSFNRMFVSTDWSESNLKAQAKILNVNLR